MTSMSTPPGSGGHVSVQEFIDELLATAVNPYKTRVYLSESEVDEPCEFIALDTVLAELRGSA